MLKNNKNYKKQHKSNFNSKKNKLKKNLIIRKQLKMNKIKYY